MNGQGDSTGVCQACHQLNRRHTTEQLERCAEQRAQHREHAAHVATGKAEPAELAEYLHALLQDLVGSEVFEAHYLEHLGLRFKRPTDPKLHDIALHLAVELIDFRPSRLGWLEAVPDLEPVAPSEPEGKTP